MVFGIFFTALLYSIIAVHSYSKYKKERKDAQRKHVFYAFAFVSLGFLADFTGALFLGPAMSASTLLLANSLFRLFDAFVVIGVYWFFVFLTDLSVPMKKYLNFVQAHAGITLLAILVTPASVAVAAQSFTIGRADVRAYAIILFWFVYWTVIAYTFWEHSKVVRRKQARLRLEMMSLGGVLAILAYAFEISALIYFAEACAIASGIVFYLGFIAPERLQRVAKK